MKPVLPIIDLAYLTQILMKLLNTPSPTGFAERAIDYVRAELASLSPLHMETTKKGALIVKIPGKTDDAPRVVAAHVDTLGAMVKEIKPNGRLKITQIGSYSWNSIEGEGCRVITANKGEIRGSILLTHASVHVHGTAVSETKRNEDSIEVRLDAKTASINETLALGIEVGDFISLDPRAELTNGFVRSRHLDDKAGAACLMAGIKTIHDQHLELTHTTYFLFSVYEESGHGAAGGILPEVEEFLTVDMAAVGEGQNSDEFHATICVKDSAGPYHHGLSSRLRKLAEENNIPYKTDIYPHYSSDGQGYWQAGGEAAVALIGPGVDASHNYERTHQEALMATTQWILAYLMN
jgi:putative aminopeptidase FrvX